MSLEQFRLKKGFSHKALAKFLGLSGTSPESTVCRWCIGDRIPRPKYMDLIKTKTKGAVKPASFYA